MPSPGDGEFSDITEQDFARGLAVVKKLVEALSLEPSEDVLLGLQLMFARECVLGGIGSEAAAKILVANAPKFVAFWEQVRGGSEGLLS